MFNSFTFTFTIRNCEQQWHKHLPSNHKIAEKFRLYYYFNFDLSNNSYKISDDHVKINKLFFLWDIFQFGSMIVNVDTFYFIWSLDILLSILRRMQNISLSICEDFFWNIQLNFWSLKCKEINFYYRWKQK